MGERLREPTKEKAAQIVRYLRGGKALKEIAWLTNLEYETVKKMALRYTEIRSAYLETYPLRHPEKPSVPPRFRLAQ